MKRLLTPCVCALAVSFVVGCSTPGVDLVKIGAASLNTQDTRLVDFWDARVYQDGDDTVITGRVRRQRSHVGGGLAGVVHVEILAADGKILKEMRVPYSPGRIPPHKLHASRFTARVPMTVPHGAIVRLSYRG